MAKRLSSLFSLSKDDSGPPPQADVHAHSRDSSLAQSPTAGRLQKHISNPSADMNPPSTLQPLTPLAPPPLLQDGFRPPSSAGSGSQPGSRADSPQSLPRSRPQTPTIVVPGAEAHSPITPTSGKLNKRKSWLPGKSDKQKAEERKNAKAWIAGLRDFVNYDVTPLLAGDRVSPNRGECIPRLTFL